MAKANSTVDVTLLEHCQREDLNPQVPRVMCVLRPLKVVIENYPEGQVEELDAPLYPHDVPKEGSRKVPFSRTLYIERDDFAENPPKGFHRLSPGREVRLRYAYLVRCESVVKDASGEIVELRCTYDPETRGGNAPDGRKVPGTLHWVSAEHAVPVEVRLYDRLFRVERPDLEEGDFEELPQSAVARNPYGKPPRARRTGPRRAPAVRAAGLLLPRSDRFDSATVSSSTAPCRCATPGPWRSRSRSRPPRLRSLPKPRRPR